METSHPPTHTNTHTMKSYRRDDTVTVRCVEKHPTVLPPATIKATAGADGRWSATVPPAKATFHPTWIMAKCGRPTLVVEYPSRIQSP